MKTTVNKEEIQALWNKATIKTSTVFDKCTIVACQLENGFVIVESSSCVDPKNYDKEMGYQICKERIINKLWEMEGYKLQQAIYGKKQGKNIEWKNDEEQRFKSFMKSLW